MKRLILISTCAIALVLASTAAAALVPGVFFQNAADANCVSSTYSAGALHLAKTCPTATVASAYGDITGLNGQTFTAGSFTLANATQCQGGSPRFNVFTTTGTFFLGCNNVIPVVNADGTATYTFTAATIAAGGNQVEVPTGTITSADVLIDVQGTADLRDITLNDVKQVPVPVVKGNANQCKHGGWKTFTNPHFKNQGQCVKHMNALKNQAKHALKHG